MPRRVNLPGADELFRATAPAAAAESEDAKTASGRVKHDEKMTVYVTAAELMAVEQADAAAPRARTQCRSRAVRTRGARRRPG